MRIERFQDEAHQHLKERQQALTVLLAQASDKEKRPCRACAVPCPCSQSRACCCACSVHCPLAPRYLSSNPDRYPIEPGIVPLVYQLNVLRVIQPCWSCEGHQTAQGQFLRLPQVWFYSASVVYPQLIAEIVHEQKFRRLLGNDWQVAVCPQDYGKSVTTFALKPIQEQEKPLDLRGLRRDVQTLSCTLVEQVRQSAREYLHDISVLLPSGVSAQRGLSARGAC
jgi:hypothetical protein